MIIKKSVMCPQDTTLDAERFKLYGKLYDEKHAIIKSVKEVKDILEIGVRAGYSAWTFLQAFPEARYVGLDAHNGTHGGAGGETGVYEAWAKKILAEYNATLIRMDTQGETDISHLGKFDFIHIDGDHTADGVYHDLCLCFSLLRDTRAKISVDDYTFLAAVKEGVDRWLQDYDGVIVHEFIPTVRGDIVIRRKM